MHSEITNSGITSPVGSTASQAHKQSAHTGSRATPDPLRSSLRELQALQRSRACGLSYLRLRRSYFTITGLVRPMSML